MRLRLIQSCTPNGNLYRVTYTRCHIDTINSPDYGHMAARNMQRIEINIHEKESCLKLVIYKDYTETHGQQNMKYPKHILEGSIYPAGWQNRPRYLNLDHHDDNGSADDDSNDLLKHDTSLSYGNFLWALNPWVPTRFLYRHRNFCLQLHA